MSTNAYGFDFLRSEHQLPPGGQGQGEQGEQVGAAAAAIPNTPPPPLHVKSDLEAQYDVLQFLSGHRTSGCLPPSVIAKATAVHLDPSSPRYRSSAGVADLLARNPKVRIEMIPDPENPTLLLPTYGYQAKFANVTDRAGLLAQVNRCPCGVGLRDLQDSYGGALRDAAALVAAGEVIAVSNPEDKDRVLFPRGEAFLVELDGIAGMGTADRYRDELVRANRELQKWRLEAQEAQEAQEAEDEGGIGNSQGKNAEDTCTSTCTTTCSKGAAKPEEKSKENGAGGGGCIINPNASTAGRGDATCTPTCTPTPTCTAATADAETEKCRLEEEQRSHRINAAIARVQEARRRLERSAQLLSIDVDPLPQIRRGEAIQVGGTWFRVSSAIREGVPLEDQPARAQAPPSVVMMRDLSKKNDAEGYVHSFAERVIPLDGRPPTEAAENLRKAKAARERLHKVAGSIKSAKSGGGTSSRVGVSGGASSQLLSSHAGAANPESLAAAFVSSFKAAAETAAGGSGGRIPGGAPGSGAVRKRTVAISGRPSAAAAAAGGPTASSSNSSNGGKSEGRKRTVTEMVQDAKEAAMDPSLYYIHARRHGCTKDVRQMFLATRADVPESEVVLHKLMIQHKLIDPGEPMRRPRMKLQSNLDNDGKPKKRRYYERKNQRMTNTHLIGHEIGAVLAKAADRQQQGKEVGDGGM